MADNYLEKHYADYEARKQAYRQGGARNAVRRAMWQVATIVLPSVDDVAMQEFYVNLFGGEADGDTAVAFDNGLRLEFAPKNADSIVKFAISMASQYQLEQLIRRLLEAGVAVEDGRVLDPSGNEILIKCF